MRIGYAAAALLLWAAVGAIPHVAVAQTADQDSVTKRPHPEFDPIGIELDDLLNQVGLVSDKEIEQKNSPLSSFVVFPSFGISTTYDSNVFLTNSNPVADKRILYSPGVSIASDWENNALSFSASGDIARYQKQSIDDYDDFQLRTAGTLDVLGDLTVSANGGIARRHDSRSAQDNPGAAFGLPVYYDSFLDTTTEYHPGAFLARFKFKYDILNYVNKDGLNNDPKDLSLFTWSTRFGYEFTPGTTFFIQPQGEVRSFREKRDPNGLLQDNSSYGFLAGLTVDTSGVTFLDFGVGLVHRDFADPSLRPQTNFDFSGRFVWNPTDLLTLRGTAGRSTTQSSAPGESGILTTSYNLELDYGFLDNVILKSIVSHSESDNHESNRIDMDYGANFGVDYLVNENWSANLSLNRSWRNSNLASQDYKSLLATVGLTGKL